MNRFFGEIPTPLPLTPTVQGLNKKRVALVLATGQIRIAELEICAIPASSQVAVSARLDRMDDPMDAMLQYLTEEAVERIHPDRIGLRLGAPLCLDLRKEAA